MLNKVRVVQVIDERGGHTVCFADHGSVGLHLEGDTLTITIKRTSDEHQASDTRDSPERGERDGEPR